MIFGGHIVYVIVLFHRRMELEDARKLAEFKKREKQEEKIARYIL
jgi:hypothetical protein